MTKAVLINNNSLYIEDYKAIDYFDSNKITIILKDKSISITGNNLIIEAFNKFNLKISGEINNIEYIHI